MRRMVDAILHIADVPALVGWFAEHAPDKLGATGDAIIGFDRTPTLLNGTAALVYMRITPDEEIAFAAAAGVTILARANHVGPETAAKVYARLFGDPQATALYEMLYPRTPIEVPDGDGGSATYTPPERFGQLA